MNFKTTTFAWKHLNGILCVYKPSGINLSQLKSTIKYKLSKDLNHAFNNNADHHVITTNFPYVSCEQVSNFNYAINLLAQKFKYLPEDIKVLLPYQLGKYTSGITILGIGERGIKIGQKLKYDKNLLRVYEIVARFGRSTDSGWANYGKIIMKSKYVNPHLVVINKVLCASQSSHQRQAFLHSITDIRSEEAFDLAKKGILKFLPTNEPFTFSAKCISCNPPDFILELHMTGETEEYILQYVEEIARRVRSVAACLKIRCIKYGPFTLEDSIVSNQWTVKNCVSNIIHCNSLINKIYNL